MAEVPNSSPAGDVQNKAPKPPGVLPRNMQARLLGGLALVMVTVIALSGRNAPKERKPVEPARTAVDPNQARIDDYRKRIEEQAQKLAAEQAALAQTRQALANSSAFTAGAPHEGRRELALERAPAGYVKAVPTRTWIDLDREKREYESLYASNVALSYRKEAGVTPQSASAAQAVNSDTGSNRGDTAGGRTETAGTEANDNKRAGGKLYRLFEGTIVETTLTNRLDGSFSGPVNCMVTTDVYSHDRQKLLIPQGSRMLGEVERVESFGQQRLALKFHRLIMPDGYSVSLDRFHGLNQIGETGLRDKVNRHYLQVFGVSLAIGAIAGLSQTNTRYGLDVAAEDAYRQGVATSLSQSSLRILDRYLNVLPTFTIREGHRVKVYLSGDLLLPAYHNHRVPHDL